MQIFDNIKNIIFNNDNKNAGLIRNIIILGILGVIFLFAGNLFTSQEANKEYITESENIERETNIKQQQTYINNVTQQLEELVSLIQGIGEARVMLLADSGIEKKYEYNIRSENRITNETDHNEGERRIKEENSDKELVVISDSQGNEKPVVKKEKKPGITGILIIAEGAESSSLKYEISKSISDFLGLPIHKINVLPHERR